MVSAIYCIVSFGIHLTTNAVIHKIAVRTIAYISQYMTALACNTYSIFLITVLPYYI